MTPATSSGFWSEKSQGDRDLGNGDSQAVLASGLRFGGEGHGEETASQDR